MNNTEHEKQTNELMVNAIYKALKRADIPVIKASDDLAEILQLAGMQVAYKKKEAPETVSASKEKHHPTAVSSADGTNILKNLDKLAKDYEEKFIKRPISFIGDIANALNISNPGRSSRYGLFETRNGKVLSIRLSNHNATVSNFDDVNEDDGLSIVVTSSPNEYIKNNGKAHIVEYYYNAINLRKAYGLPLVEIINSIKEALLSGEYKDTTGLAQREEVNATFLKDKTGTIYGWTSNGSIYLTKDGMNPRTLLHEYTHLWSNAMQIANPEGWQSIKDIMREDPLWNKVQSDSNYADIADDEDMLVSEVLSRRSEKNNVALLTTQAQKVLREGAHDKDYQANQLLFKMKEALNMFWDWVTTKLFSMKHFQSEEQVSNRVLYDLVNSTPLSQDKELKDQPQYSIEPAVNEINISNATVIEQGYGYAIRCKVNGIQQLAETLTPSEQRKYLQLLQSGNKDELSEYLTTLAEKHFGGTTESENRNKGLKR